MTHNRKISVIGLGYVGLPVAVSFANACGRVIAYDIDKERIKELLKGYDRTKEVISETLACADLHLTTNAADLSAADFHIVTVPTPVDDNNNPNLTPLLSASQMLASFLKVGDIVVYESTVYPGATRNLCVPMLERESGLRFGKDFFVGYSPERINPGDLEHRFETIKKVVSGSDLKTLETIACVYESAVKAGVYRAPNIETAEAAKVIENTQRDLNIALMNELAVIFDRLGLDTEDVLSAAGTKWNFLPFVPGLVGGHCIGVDPYYLTHRAEEVGCTPEVILAGRKINDSMGAFVVDCVTKKLLINGKTPEDNLVTVLGITFKENVPDIRNSRIQDVLRELKKRRFRIQVHDPLADAKEVVENWGIQLVNGDNLIKGNAVILGVPHAEYLNAGWGFIQNLLSNGRGIVGDVKGCLDRDIVPPGIDLWRL